MSAVIYFLSKGNQQNRKRDAPVFLESSDSIKILVMGMPGAGKSSLVDFLFGRKEVAKAEFSNENIREFSVQVQNSTEEEEVSKIFVITTPGFKDNPDDNSTEETPLVQTLRTVFEITPETSVNPNPEIILLVARYDDNRIVGQGSAFVKMLKGLKKFLKDVSEQKSKLILVLTHFMNEKKENREHPEVKVKLFLDLIQQYTNIQSTSVPVVFAENEAEDRGLPQEEDNDYRLSSAEIFPQNIFYQMAKTAEENGNTTASNIILNAYKQNTTLELLLERIYEIANSGASRPNIKESGFLNIQKNPVNDALQSYWVQMGFQNSPHSAYLTELQRALQSRGINELSKLPKNNDETLDLVNDLPKNPILAILLRNALGLKLVKFPSVLTLGKGYDVLQDKTLFNSTIFENAEECISVLGFLLPSNLICEVENATVRVANIFETPSALVSKRMADISINDHDVSPSKYKGKIDGYNLRPTSSLIAVKEHRIMKLTLSNETNLTEEFKMDVLALEESNSENEWMRFFCKYGTHVIVSAFAGGLTRTTASGNGVAFIDDKTLGQIVDRNAGQNSDSNVTYRYELIGGDHIQGDPLLDSLESKNIEMLTKWRNSLAKNPCMLPTELKLLPISIFARKCLDSLGIKFDMAIKRYLGSGTHSQFSEINLPSKQFNSTSTNYGGSNYRETSLVSQVSTSKNRSAGKTTTGIPASTSYGQQGSVISRPIATDYQHPGVNTNLSGIGFKEDSHIYTLNGWKRLSDIRSGDTVYDKNLQPGTVRSVFYNFVQSATFFGFDDKFKDFFTSGVTFESENGNTYQAEDRHGPVAVGKTINDVANKVKVLKLIPKSSTLRAELCKMVKSEISKQESGVCCVKVDTPSGTFIVNGFVFHQ